MKKTTYSYRTSTGAVGSIEHEGETVASLTVVFNTIAPTMVKEGWLNPTYGQKCRYEGVAKIDGSSYPALMQSSLLVVRGPAIPDQVRLVF